eukprot:353939-Chlamydomonas_euryale.AAC.12
MPRRERPNDLRHRAPTLLPCWITFHVQIRNFRRHRALKLLQQPCAPHLGGLLQAVTRLANADVEHQLAHADLPHRVGSLILGCTRGGGHTPAA